MTVGGRGSRVLAPEFFVALGLEAVERRGKGLLMREKVARDQRVLSFGGPVLSRVEYQACPDIEHCLQVGPELFLGPSGAPDDFTNHSCAPSTRVEIARDGDRALLVALRDLAPGTEVTFDYSSVQLDDPLCELGDCRCGAPECRGRIGDFTALDRIAKARMVARGLCVWYVVDAYTAELGSAGLRSREPRQK